MDGDDPYDPMMTRDAAHNLGRFHPAQGRQPDLYAANRAVYAQLIDHIYDVLPDPTPERDITVRRAHDTLVALNVAVAVNGVGASDGDT